MSENENPTATISPVTVLRERIDAWRKDRPKPRCRMPEELWAEVVELARVYGTHSIARALRVDYYSLKERLQVPTNDTAKARPGFVEVAVCPSPSSAEYVVELERPDGARMKIRTTKVSDLVSLTEVFWSARA